MESQGVGEEEITEEQRKRAEANRLVALAKRKAVVSENPDGFESAWKLFRCRKFSTKPASPVIPKPMYPFLKCGSAPNPEMPVTEKFRVRLEICSPDSFSITPMPAPGVPYPGNEACLEKLSDWLSGIIPSQFTQTNGGGKACTFRLNEYHMVLRSLKNCDGIKCEEIPWGTFNVVEKMSHSYAAGKWIPCRPEHLTNEKVDELIQNLPKVLLDALLPFQLEGVRFGLQRGGRCLIADEMGLGKTLQAIAIAGCFINEGPILIVCPAILRYTWAEELERWLPFCLPSDIHLVFCHQDNPAYLAKCPRIVVISYTMLEHLQRSMFEREWATLIIDESHHLRCTKRSSEPKEVPLCGQGHLGVLLWNNYGYQLSNTRHSSVPQYKLAFEFLDFNLVKIKSVLNVAAKVKHLILLSGTPSLSRPGLLGKTKYEFANTYCSVNLRQGSQGKKFQDFSRGIRLEELNILLKQTVMIRRLKQHVMSELPPLRRKIIRLDIKKSDISLARAAIGEVDRDASASEDAEDELSELSVKDKDQVLGLAKLPGFLEWLSMHPVISGFHCEEAVQKSSHKMIIFAHHHKVLDRIQAHIIDGNVVTICSTGQSFVQEKGIECIHIDGRKNPRDRKNAVQDFQSSSKVKIALIGILAGGSGLNLTAAQDVVILELPQEIANLNQAEGRAHRIGQAEAVNVYVFCAKDTPDESRWQIFNDRLFQVSSTIDGKYDAIHEIKVDSVSHFEAMGIPDENSNKLVHEREANTRISLGSLSPFRKYDHSYELIDKSNGAHKESDVISSEVECLKSEHIPSLSCDGSPKVSSGTARKASSYNLEHIEAEDQQVNIVDEINANASGISKPSEVSVQRSNQVSSLCFEVSRYTERVYLYSYTPGVDSRPQPLFQSFMPEELESEDRLSEGGMKMVNKCTEDCSNYQSAVLRFWEQWKQLRSIEKKKLRAKPLQLPLSTELHHLAEGLNHNKGGLLKGGSKRRTTPSHEISNPLPSNASWKVVTLFSTYSKKEKTYKQGWSSKDEPLCMLCQNPCKNENAKKPEFFEDLFCNLECYEEYILRTSNRSLREALFQIEHGICTNCQLDCHKLVEHLKPLSYERRQEYIQKVAPKLAMHRKLVDKLVHDPVEGNAWHSDHLVPVFQGGGECRLENLRTLCVACHADVTSAQCAERRLAREKAKRQLKIIMNNLKCDQEPAEIDGKTKDHQQFATPENMEDDLFIEVPGSAYSSTKAINVGSSEQQFSC